MSEMRQHGALASKVVPEEIGMAMMAVQTLQHHTCAPECASTALLTLPFSGHCPLGESQEKANDGQCCPFLRKDSRRRG